MLCMQINAEMLFSDHAGAHSTADVRAFILRVFRLSVSLWLTYHLEP